MKNKNYSLLLLDGHSSYKLNLSIKMLGISCTLLLLLLIYSFSVVKINSNLAIPKANIENALSQNNLLKTKMYILYEHNKQLNTTASNLNKSLDVIQALTNIEENAFQYNTGYKNVTIEEETVGYRVLVYKIKIGNRKVFEYISDNMKPKKKEEAKQRVALIQANLDQVIKNNMFTPYIKIVNVGEDEYIGMIDDLIVFSVNKEDSLHLQIPANELAEKYKNTLYSELKISKQNKLLLETPVVRSIDLINTHTALRSLSDNTMRALEFSGDILQKNNLKVANAYSKIAQFKANFALTPSIYPLRSVEISSPFGYRIHPITGKVLLHNGLDMAAYPETRVYSTAEGRVTYAGWMGGYGNAIQVYHGLGLSTIYGHCSSVTVRRGQYIKKGVVIGYSGSTGLSAGPHLHYELRRWNVAIDPTPYLKRDILTAKSDW